MKNPGSELFFNFPNRDILFCYNCGNVVNYILSLVRVLPLYSPVRVFRNFTMLAVSVSVSVIPTSYLAISFTASSSVFFVPSW